MPGDRRIYSDTRNTSGPYDAAIYAIHVATCGLDRYSHLAADFRYNTGTHNGAVMHRIRIWSAQIIISGTSAIMGNIGRLIGKLITIDTRIIYSLNTDPVPACNFTGGGAALAQINVGVLTR